MPPLDPEFLLARWVAEDLPLEEVPALAVQALSEGCTSASVAYLAALRPERSEDIDAELPRLAREIGVAVPTVPQAVKAITDAWLLRAVSGDVHPVRVASRVAILCDPLTDTPELSSQLGVFVRLADEWHGSTPDARARIETEIVDVARQFVDRGGLKIAGTFHVSWGFGATAIVTTDGEIAAVLERAEVEARRFGNPQSVEIEGPDGLGTLGVVVGHERSVLHHVPADGDPPYLASRGDEDHDEMFVFYVAGDHYSELPWNHTVPTATAREAARVFVTERRLDDRIDWIEV